MRLHSYWQTAAACSRGHPVLAAAPPNAVQPATEEELADAARHRKRTEAVHENKTDFVCLLRSALCLLCSFPFVCAMGRLSHARNTSNCRWARQSHCSCASNCRRETRLDRHLAGKPWRVQLCRRIKARRDCSIQCRGKKVFRRTAGEQFEG